MIGRARWAVIAVVVVAVAVAAVVARSTPSHPFVSHSLAPLKQSGPLLTPPQLTDLPQPSARATPGADDSSWSFTHWFGVALLAVLALVVMVFASRYALGRWSIGGVGRRGRYALGNELVEQDGEHLQELTRALSDGMSAMESGPVSDAIIACWVRLEAIAASTGMRPAPSETSTELVARLLGRYGARRVSLQRLAALYREARFSTHELGDVERAQAQQCLADIRAETAGDHEPR